MFLAQVWISNDNVVPNTGFKTNMPLYIKFLVNPCILVKPCNIQNSDYTTSCDTIFQYALTNFGLDEILQKR